ncbi:MAG: glycosyl hydrolase family 39 [Acidobacterium ailaaui]|nr:glycosyl hydrolase family 39 [Pseudacidobacterium ailaaui]
MLKRGSPIHDSSFKALQNLKVDYVRFVPWYPYPHAAVPELRPPTKDSTFWDFSQIDPIVEDFMNATEGHSVIMNFSTIPVWMFRTDKPVEVPSDPDSVFWAYNKGTELRDTTLKELTDYFVRLFSWYTKGGFTDELGHYHKSGYHYKFQYWEVLNEPDLEHHISPQLYTRIYDAVVPALKKISPETKFVGLALALENTPEWFEYFLNHKNHKPGVPLDGISYHFYARPSPQDKPIEGWQYSFFEQADNFLVKVRYIENIRKRLSPHTFTDLDELGVILGDQTGKNITDPAYWNLAGAMYAYLYVELAKMGIEVAGESQLVGYPSQFPSVSMMNWTNGKPNARYWILKLLKDNFGPGDKLVATNSNASEVTAQAFITPEGNKLLLVNKRSKPITLELPDNVKEYQVQYVDVSTGDGPPGKKKLINNSVTLNPFSVTIVQF